ncbi:hypothetical protein BDA96_09G252600 [Sorghum bicolor]|uniref:DUF7356 domain-containing protein n=2 Tax=Sorghum bicolor TaxID=4558 RepID=C5YW04_SORBI|nr:uncharacterized protein LOC8074623 isoform X1 [Sorghum bicolor]EES19976.1 hypothetical protein SORBI_3009G238800 [Sorghum bicolor]KAG0519304.1 hypothetical protein BDA96_09G252600 [Sorghum bicolor]|eukprot:XP_002441546.1 uncharacterized protein LOC8074623 isoform X1 [Sorghum bicolor]
MRRTAALLLVTVFAVVAVAKGSADTPPAETNGDSSSAQSGVGKLEQHDQTNPNPNKEHVTQQKGGVSNDIGDNNKKDNSTEGTDVSRDDLTPQPKDKDNSITKPSQARDFWEDPLIKECDPSHRCIIENKKFIACLKVSGEDSSALSLLMDNRGVNPLDVSITAPDYVTLAEDAIHVKANDHNETQVRVSVSDDANKATIVLKVAENSCNISIHNAITRETGRVIRMPLTSTYTLLPIFLLLAVVGVCIMLRRTRKQDGEPAYQKLDMSDLPVSVGGKKETDDQSDKWDDNWGDDWDDEEAPMTPSKPLPNPSSKGLASRRSTKDGWKD